MEPIDIVGTADTKGNAPNCTAHEVAAAGGTPFIVDVVTRRPRCTADIAADEAARQPRRTAVAAMGAAG